MVPVIAGLGHEQIKVALCKTVTKPHFVPLVVMCQVVGRSRHETLLQDGVSKVNCVRKAQTLNFSSSSKVRELQADLF